MQLVWTPRATGRESPVVTERLTCKLNHLEGNAGWKQAERKVMRVISFIS